MTSRIATFFLILTLSVGKAQNIKVTALFVEDSIELGKETPLVLIVKHKNQSEILFPDTSRYFWPFQIQKIEYFETYQQQGFWVDSVVYYLKTFVVKPQYELAIPVDVLSFRKIISNSTSILLKSSVHLTDLQNPTPKINLKYFNFPEKVNFPKIILITFLSIAFILVLVAFFKDILVQYFRLLIFFYKHYSFKISFKTLNRDPKNPEYIKRALFVWKEHLNFLLQESVSSMTTREIFERFKNQRLELALKEFDLALYGGTISNKLPFAFNILYEFAQSTYEKQREIINIKRL